MGRNIRFSVTKWEWHSTFRSKCASFHLSLNTQLVRLIFPYRRFLFSQSCLYCLSVFTNVVHFLHRIIIVNLYACYCNLFKVNFASRYSILGNYKQFTLRIDLSCPKAFPGLITCYVSLNMRNIFSNPKIFAGTRNQDRIMWSCVCDVCSCNHRNTLRRGHETLPPSSGRWGSNHHWNVGRFIPNFTAQHSTRLRENLKSLPGLVFLRIGSKHVCGWTFYFRKRRICFFFVVSR